VLNADRADLEAVVFEEDAVVVVGLGMKAIIAFCDKHNVSTDWLLFGDLKGLQRMTKWRAQSAKPRIHAAMTADEFKAFCRLEPDAQEFIGAYMRAILRRRPPS
jgi:hypothetical protein